MTSLVDVALPVPLFRTFTYEVNGDVARAVTAGSRVVVPFGQRKEIGIVVGEGKPRPGVSPKRVLEVPDPEPVLGGPLLALCQWLADYYVTPVGVALRCALPAALSGAKIAVAVAVIGAVFAEYSGSSEGLGHLMLQAIPQLETPRAYAGVVLLTLMALAMFLLVALAERLALPWARKGAA